MARARSTSWPAAMRTGSGSVRGARAPGEGGGPGRATSSTDAKMLDPAFAGRARSSLTRTARLRPAARRNRAAAGRGRGRRSGPLRSRSLLARPDRFAELTSRSPATAPRSKLRNTVARGRRNGRGAGRLGLRPRALLDPPFQDRERHRAVLSTSWNCLMSNLAPRIACAFSRARSQARWPTL